MDQSVECLLCKHQILSSDSHVNSCISNRAAAGVASTGGSLEFTGQTAQPSDELQVP